jgi:hypothetical protein
VRQRQSQQRPRIAPGAQGVALAGLGQGGVGRQVQEGAQGIMAARTLEAVAHDLLARSLAALEQAAEFCQGVLVQ